MRGAGGEGEPPPVCGGASEASDLGKATSAACSGPHSFPYFFLDQSMRAPALGRHSSRPPISIPHAFAQRPRSISDSAATMTLPGSILPKLIAFDLDATLWCGCDLQMSRRRAPPLPPSRSLSPSRPPRIPEMYELCGPPFKLDKKDPNYVVDGSGERVRLMGASRAILGELATHERWRDTVVAYVSRTEYPRWADACLKLFSVAPGVSMADVATEQEIYPGSKTRHFARIHTNTGIAYEDMLFWDNEKWNTVETAEVGVCSVHCPEGMTEAVWKAGLEAFAAAAAARARGEKPKLDIRTASSRRW